MKTGRKNIYRYIVRDPDGRIVYSGNCRGAADFLGYTQSHISAVCRGMTSWHGGFAISREVIR